MIETHPLLRTQRQERALRKGWGTHFFVRTRFHVAIGKHIDVRMKPERFFDFWRHRTKNSQVGLLIGPERVYKNSVLYTLSGSVVISLFYARLKPRSSTVALPYSIVIGLPFARK